jgi:hypothetical protein
MFMPAAGSSSSRTFGFDASARDLQQALLRIRQLRGAIIGAMGEADDIECLMRVAIDASFAVSVPRIGCQNIEKRGRAVAGSRNLYVFDHTQIIENPDVLERTGETEPRDPMRFETKYLLAADTNGAGVGMRGAAQRIEQSGFA